MDEPIYFFETYDRKNGLQIGDFSYKIILNTKCSPEKVPEKLKGFYEYIRNPETADKVGFIKELDDRVSKFDTEDWRVREVTLEELIDGKAVLAIRDKLKRHHLIARKRRNLDEPRLDAHLRARTGREDADRPAVAGHPDGVIARAEDGVDDGGAAGLAQGTAGGCK